MLVDEPDFQIPPVIVDDSSLHRGPLLFHGWGGLGVGPRPLAVGETVGRLPASALGTLILLLQSLFGSNLKKVVAESPKLRVDTSRIYAGTESPQTNNAVFGEPPQPQLAPTPPSLVPGTSFHSCLE